MSIQTIIDRAQTIEVDRRKIAAQTISRSQRIKTAERAASQPWRLKVTPPAAIRYSEARKIIEDIQTTDRVQEVEINLANNPRLNYLTEYQGDLTTAARANLTITNFTSTTMTIAGLPTTASTTVIFRPGDFVQPHLSRYPYTVTETVYRGTGTSVTATVNRPIITSENTTTTGPVLIGTSVTFRMVVLTLPTYQMVPYDRVQWTGPFDLV